MTRNKKLFLSVFSALLLWACWPAGGFTSLVFISLVPLLLLEHYAVKDKTNKTLFGYTYLTFLLWNGATTWWVCNATLGGGLFAIFCNALFMTVVFQLFHVVHRRAGDVLGYSSLIIFWLAFEYLHLHWELSWPWLTLGNVFSTQPMWVQWYEWTGSLGGSLWILSVNILITQWLLTGEEKRRKKMYSVLLLIVIPCAVSAIRYYTYTEAGKTIRVISTQPNIDPYNEKFSGMSNEEQIIRVLQLANLESPDSADYILAPETAIANSLWESELENYSEIKLLRSYIKAYPHVRLIIGASTNKLYASDEKLSATARRFTQQEGYYDSYNTALFIQSEKPLQIFHKSKLVPGVERMPYSKIFGFLEKLSINMGGTSGSLGVQPEPTVFISSDSVVTAPVICYESIYGDYLAEYVRKGAQWIAVITNDGWWGNTPGYRQHFQYARIHAIELRRDIARSANTGISGFINQRGDVLQQTPYWQEAVIRERITLNNQKTVYARFGDYIGVIAACLILPLLLTAFLKRRESI